MEQIYSTLATIYVGICGVLVDEPADAAPALGLKAGGELGEAAMTETVQADWATHQKNVFRSHFA
jgi:hypothetical protein